MDAEPTHTITVHEDGLKYGQIDGHYFSPQRDAKFTVKDLQNIIRLMENHQTSDTPVWEYVSIQKQKDDFGRLILVVHPGVYTTRPDIGSAITVDGNPYTLDAICKGVRGSDNLHFAVTPVVENLEEAFKRFGPMGQVPSSLNQVVQMESRQERIPSTQHFTSVCNTKHGDGWTHVVQFPLGSERPSAGKHVLIDGGAYKVLDVKDAMQPARLALTVIPVLVPQRSEKQYV